MPPPPKSLNHKQKAFATHYAVTGNATAAAISAGYSARTAHSAGPRLLADVGVRALIDEKTAKAVAKVEVKGERILEEAKTFAHSDLVEAFCDDGTLKHLRDMPESLRRAIKSIEFTELFEGASGEKFVVGRTVKIALWSKETGLKLLGDNLGLFKQTVVHEVGESLAELLAEARAPESPE